MNLQTIPTNYWFHVMTATDSEEAKNEALRVVRKMVKPGSIVVADCKAKICSYYDLLDLKEYPVIVSIQELMAHNRPGCTILGNLGKLFYFYLLLRITYIHFYCMVSNTHTA